MRYLGEDMDPGSSFHNLVPFHISPAGSKAMASNSTTSTNEAMASNSTTSTTEAMASNSTTSTTEAMASNSTTSTTEAMADLEQIQIHSLPPCLTHQSIIPSLHLDSSCPTPTNNSSDRAQASPNDVIAAPEELIMCAFTLAVLEKVASWLGVVGFMVATVVLLGGLATMLEMKDFVLIGLMLFIEGIRIIFRIHYTQQLMPIICFINRWFQLISAIIVGALSAMQLASQDFGKIEEPHNAIRDISLNIFYAVVLGEAHVLLAKMAFFEWKVSYCELLKKVTSECGLDLSDMISIEKFFNDAYYKSVTGSIFNALKMDLVTFAADYLCSSSGEEQLMGARILEALSMHEHLCDVALRKIGASTAVIKRLIQMRICSNIFEENIRNSANVILTKLAHKEPNVLGVATMEEATRPASTLLNSYHLD